MEARRDGIRTKDGKPLAFTLITQAGFAIRENVAQAIQRQFQRRRGGHAGQLIDGTTISGVWFSGDFDAMLHWWQSGADPEITLFFASDRTPPAGRNINYFADDSLTRDALRVGSHGRSGEAKRAAAARRSAESRSWSRRSRSTTRRRSTPFPPRSRISRAIRRMRGLSGTCTSGSLPSA